MVNEIYNGISILWTFKYKYKIIFLYLMIRVGNKVIPSRINKKIK